MKCACIDRQHVAIDKSLLPPSCSMLCPCCRSEGVTVLLYWLYTILILYIIILIVSMLLILSCQQRYHCYHYRTAGQKEQARGQWWFCSSLLCRQANIWWFTLDTLPPWQVDWQGPLLLTTQTQSLANYKVRFVCWPYTADHDCTECHLEAALCSGGILLQAMTTSSLLRTSCMAVSCLKKD